MLLRDSFRKKAISTGGGARESVPAASVDARAEAGRLRALDGLRLLAALMVAVYHFLALDDDAARAWGQSADTLFPQADFLAPYGWLGVEVFYIISGFVICMSCWGRTLGDFFRSRVIRLYPAYWAAVVLTFTVVTLAPVVFDPAPYWDAMVNLTMLQDPLGVDRVDDVYWTLWVELRFYLIFALVVSMGLTYRRVIAFCLAWTVMAPIVRASEFAPLDVIVMPKYAHYFLIGVGLYLVHRFGHQLLTWLTVGANAMLAQHYAVLRMKHQANDVVNETLHPWIVTAVLFGSALLILAIARGHLSWVRWRWVTTAGALTYPFYLLHQRIGFTVIHWLYVDAGMSAYIVLPMTIAAMLVLAWLVHRYVEKPLAGWIKQRLSSGRGLALDPPDLLAAPTPAPVAPAGLPSSGEAGTASFDPSDLPRHRKPQVRRRGEFAITRK